MILEVCSNDFLFFSAQNDKINLFCYFIILLCILLCMIIKNRKKSGIKFNNVTSKIIILFTSIIFIFFMVITCILSFNKIKYEGCYCEYAALKQINTGEKFEIKSVDDIIYNKVIIVGDSRMEYIERDREKLKIPINFSFIAKSGATIHWFEDTALPKLKKELDNVDGDYNYHVVINMGVNDFQEDINIEKRVYEYFNLYKELSLQYPNINFYFLSVNPVVDNIITDYFPSNKRSNKKIIEFNHKMGIALSESKIENLVECDSYHEIKFNAPDGLHYNIDTDQDILNFISKRCILYK